MNDEKNTIPVNKITHKNTPNDDEEVLKNGDEPVLNKVENNEDEKRMKRCEKLQGSESTGIP